MAKDALEIDFYISVAKPALPTRVQKPSKIGVRASGYWLSSQHIPQRCNLNGKRNSLVLWWSTLHPKTAVIEVFFNPFLKMSQVLWFRNGAVRNIVENINPLRPPLF